MDGKRGSLQKRITLSVILGMLIILLSFGIVSYYIVQKNIEDSLNKKLALARLIRNNIDNIIKDNINRLYDISLSGNVDLDDNDFGPEINALSTAYRYSIFTDGIFLLDMGGNVILNYPERLRDTALNVLSIEPISRMIALRKPVVSNIYTIEPEKRKVLFVLVPLKDKNDEYIGVTGGEIDPTNPILTHMLKLIDIGENTFIDIMDSNGVVIASSNPSRTLTYCDRGTFFNKIISEKKERIAGCHLCHIAGNKSEKSTTILAFVPLEMAPWGISIQEPEGDVFAPAVKLKRTFIALGIIFIGTAFILMIGMSRSIVNPIKELINGTDRIAKGDLSRPVPPYGRDEIGILSKSFETMRVRLVESMESIKRYSLELERRVAERTSELQHSRKRLANLLDEIINAQEEERKRVARELHDETSQSLAALGMSIDIAAIALKENSLSFDGVQELKHKVDQVLDGINLLIRDLRPPVFDDLGLESALRWLLEKHLGEKGIAYYLTTTEEFKRAMSEYSQPLPAERKTELMLFRIIQEVIINIDKHARASNVFVHLDARDSNIQIVVEDDGIGFDVQSVSKATDRDETVGFGILGMKERVALLDGKLTICSTIGVGTSVTVDVPLNSLEIKDV
jgi:signal transduction histidine kinase